MNIKNYTSKIAVESTIARIECKLAAMGATHIMKTYGEKSKVLSVVFNIPDRDKSIPIRVPANVKGCFDAMWRQYCINHTHPRDSAKPKIYEQAERTAWKLVQDWIEVQVSMVEMKQAEPLQVFLPYAWDGKQTYFELMRSGGFKQLAAYNREEAQEPSLRG